MHSTFAKKSQACRRSVTRALSCTGQQAARASPGVFLPIVQAKLRIGAPNDKPNGRRIRVADVVTRMPDPSTNSGDASADSRSITAAETDPSRPTPTVRLGLWA